jgi:hypothetical protein
MAGGWNGLKLDQANKLLAIHDIEIFKNEEENNYWAKHPNTNIPQLRNSSISGVFEMVMEYWFVLKTDNQTLLPSASFEPCLVVSAKLLPNQTN